MFLQKHGPLNKHLEATQSSDVELLAQAFVERALFIGTDDTEVMNIEDLFPLMREHPDAPWKMELRHRRIFNLEQSLNLAEFIEFVTHVTYGPMRAAGTLVWNTEHGWRINSYVLSFSVPNAVVDETDFLTLVACSK